MYANDVCDAAAVVTVAKSVSSAAAQQAEGAEVERSRAKSSCDAASAYCSVMI